MVLISVDVPEDIKQRKDKLGLTWGYLIMRGVQAQEGKQETIIKELTEDNKKIQNKLRDVVMRMRELEDKLENVNEVQNGSNSEQ